LSAVLDAPYEELIRVEGVGRHTAVLLSMFPQLFREYRKDLLSRLPLNSSRDAGIHMMAHFAGLQQEHVALVCLDAKNRIISTQMLQEGGITEVQVSIRRVMATALQNSAVLSLSVAFIAIVTILSSVLYEHSVMAALSIIVIVMAAPDALTFFSFGKLFPTYLLTFTYTLGENLMDIIVPVVIMAAVSCVLFFLALRKCERAEILR
jgi:hypothetical protein